MNISFVLEYKNIKYYVYLSKEYIDIKIFPENITNDEIVEIKGLLENYFCKYSCDNILRFLEYELSYFKISGNAQKKLGKEFCNYFIKDHDPYLFFNDKKAKHFLIDLDAIKKNKKQFFKQPKLFPFYITYLNIYIDENYDIFHKNQKISPKEVFKLENEYIKSLLPIIRKKDKIYSAIIKDIKRKSLQIKQKISTIKKSDTNLQTVIYVFDKFGNIIIEFDLDNKEKFFKFFDIEINILTYRIIKKFTPRIIEKKLDIWSEVKLDLQMFCKI
jgi:hypothetical protein